MAFDRNQVFDYIATADSWINLNDSLGEINIRTLIEPLIESINDEGGVSYVLGQKERYRSSTLATVLDALADVQLLPLSAIWQMQDHLYNLKDSFKPLSADDDVITRSAEDKDAWGIDEAPSVWTTSQAIIALMNTRYITRDGLNPGIQYSLRDTVYWLADQAYSNGGWGYQKYPASSACQACVPMTALAMKAILLAQANPILFNDDAKRSNRFQKIKRALNGGKVFLLEHLKTDAEGYAYWEYRGCPGTAITMWATDTLKLFAESTIPGYSTEDYAAIEKSTIGYIYKTLPTDDSLGDYCQSEKFFVATKQEGGLKYKVNLKNDKCFYAFKPYIISSLLDRGEDPLNPQIVLMVKWLLKNRDQHWAIDEYNSSSPCCISAAMAINVIVKWLKKVSEKSFSRSVRSLVSDGVNEECEYGFPCNRQPNTSPVNSKRLSTKYLLFLAGSAIIISAVILYYGIPSRIKLGLNALCVLLCAFALNSPPVHRVFTILLEEKRSLFIGVVGSLLATFIMWVLGVFEWFINFIRPNAG